MGWEQVISLILIPFVAVLVPVVIQQSRSIRKEISDTATFRTKTEGDISFLKGEATRLQGELSQGSTDFRELRKDIGKVNVSLSEIGGKMDTLMAIFSKDKQGG